MNAEVSEVEEATEQEVAEAQGDAAKQERTYTYEELEQRLQAVRGESPDEVMVSLKEAVAVLGCDTTIFWTEVKEGRVPGAKKVAGKWILPLKSLDGYMCPDKIAAVKSTLKTTQAQLDKAKEILTELGLTEQLAAIEAAAAEVEAASEEVEEDADAVESAETAEVEEMEFDATEAADEDEESEESEEEEE